ncbi:MAG: hypothetical protein HOL98_14835 [Gammaproteobacteria bacterium]|nr:hypothetical protein [Gammaproteobacteria bacterium]MBT5204732.1 hypothetical protein [Gammaproteobacteria bacterium]MBT5601674.1 hypothetical protein [Gammaproteobacteria bacterium]MBT6245263.1 hypothetical protein [Gammaproteobacteria bacterium]
MPDQLCNHNWHGNAGDHPSGLRILYLIDDWQGPTAAIIKCLHCALPGIIWMQAWSGKLNSLRIFSLAKLRTSTVKVFLDNQNRAFCDLARPSMELEALVASAEPCCQLFALDLNTGHLGENISCDDWSKISYQSWQLGLPYQAYWQQRFSLPPDSVIGSS